MENSSDVNDDTIEELEDGQPASSAGEESSGVPPAEGVKPVTPKDQEQSKTVPYERFEEVNRKAREYEEALSEHKDKFVRDPITGKLKFRMPEEKPKPKDEDELTDEDLLVFDDTQMRVLQKLANRIQKQVFGTLSAKETYQAEFQKSWSEATKKFPALLDQTSELYKEANRILVEEYAQKLPNGQVYVPPKAHYDASVKAAWILKERAEEQERAKEENLKMKNQNTFVSKGSKKEAPDSGKKKKGDDFENLSPEEQEELIQEEYEEQNKE